MKRYAAAVLINEKEVLLAKRTAGRSNYPGIWDFVGGHCEPGETFEEAMVRELKQETGATVTEATLLMTVDKKPDFVLNLLLVTEWDGNVFNADEREHEQVKWFPLQEAKQLAFFNSTYLAALELVERL